MAIMTHMISKVVPKDALVLDVGSWMEPEQGHSYREIMAGREYVGVDLREGLNVDVVMPSPYEIPYPDGTFDAVISGQMLEHCERPWAIVAEMARVLAVGGVMILIAPSAGYEHRFPLDCWRILPDGMNALGDEAGLDRMAVAQADDEPWNSVVGVFKKVTA
jgi:SAM-dependent methyltransferase